MTNVNEKKMTKNFKRAESDVFISLIANSSMNRVEMLARSNDTALQIELF